MQEYVYRILNKNKNKFTESEKIIIYNNKNLFIKIYRIFSIDYFNKII